MVQQRKNTAQPAAVAAAKTAVSASTQALHAHADADRIDVYIRMNMDTEKDYCFNVPVTEPISFLYAIFEQLPIQLHPGYFYYPRPKGFSVSVHPGYLTAEGALLFTTDSMKEKWLKHVPDDTLIGDAVAEGQLIIPEWKPHVRHEFSVVLFLLGWLYLDLPEFISPTPGTAPYIWLSKIVDLFIPTPSAPNPEESIFNHWGWQIVFFILHIIKVVFIYYLLWNGAWNPSTLNPLKRLTERSQGIKKPNREDLVKMGWTGARRMGDDDWPEKYRNYRNERAGGLLVAFRSGLLKKPIGIMLREGEGWNVLAGPGDATLLKSIKVGSNLLNAEGKFVVSPAYFDALGAPLVKLVREQESEDEVRQTVKDFRTYGYLDGPKVLTDLFDLVEETHGEPRKLDL